MKTTPVRTSTEDNLILQGMLYEPNTSTKKAVLFIHGIGGNYYQDTFIDVLAAKCTSNEHTFLSVNTRGHDEVSDIPLANTEDEYRTIGSAYEFFDESIFDLKAWIQFLENHKYKEVILIGHSHGASKIAYYLGKQTDPRVTKVAFLAPIPIKIIQLSPNFKELVKVAFHMKKNGQKELMPIKILGTFDMSPDAFLHNMKNIESQNIFNIYDSSQHSLLSEITQPMLTIMADKDKYQRFVPIPVMFEYINEKAVLSKVNTVIIEGSGHSFVGFEKVLAKILMNWVKA